MFYHLKGIAGEPLGLKDIGERGQNPLQSRNIKGIQEELKMKSLNMEPENNKERRKCPS